MTRRANRQHEVKFRSRETASKEQKQCKPFLAVAVIGTVATNQCSATVWLSRVREEVAIGVIRAGAIAQQGSRHF